VQNNPADEYYKNANANRKLALPKNSKIHCRFYSRGIFRVTNSTKKSNFGQKIRHV
jgi:hypothetical protein